MPINVLLEIVLQNTKTEQISLLQPLPLFRRHSCYIVKSAPSHSAINII